MEETERKSVKSACEGNFDSGQGVLEKHCDQEHTGEDRVRSPEADKDELTSKLDISSDQFDPLLALYSPDIPLPYPNIKCFNNVAEYQSFLKGGRGRAKPENVEKKLRKAKKGVPDPERVERLKKLMVNNTTEEGEGSGVKRPPRKQRAVKNVLTRMPLHAGSPLGELNRCVQEKIRVKVHIRTFKGLRGVCSGFVVAFDKFWNMALVDVDETYREPLRGEALYHEKALTVTRLFDKLKLQESQELSAVEERKQVSKATAKGQRPNPQEQGAGSSAHRSPRGGPRRDARPAQHRQACPGGDGAAPPRAGAREEHEPMVGRPKTEYGRVHTRHISQLFIRGENVLLVNVQQD